MQSGRRPGSRIGPSVTLTFNGWIEVYQPAKKASGIDRKIEENQEKTTQVKSRPESLLSKREQDCVGVGWGQKAGWRGHEGKVRRRSQGAQ